MEALTAALSAIAARGVDRMVCAGDLVGYYSDAEACVQLVRERRMPCVLGNHDAVAAGLSEPRHFSEAGRRAIFWTRENISDEARSFLSGLPVVQVIDEAFVLVHGALHPEPNETLRMVSEAEAARSFDVLAERYAGVDLCFFGHTHWPAVYQRGCGSAAKIAGDEIELEPGMKYLVNPGSVGQPRDGTWYASFAIFDSQARLIRLERVEFNKRATVRKAVEAGAMVMPGLLDRSAGWIYGHLQRGRAAMTRARNR